MKEDTSSNNCNNVDGVFQSSLCTLWRSDIGSAPSLALDSAPPHAMTFSALMSYFVKRSLSARGIKRNVNSGTIAPTSMRVKNSAFGKPFAAPQL